MNVYIPCSFTLNWTNNSSFSLNNLKSAAARAYGRWHQDGLSRMRFSFQWNSCTPGNTVPNDGSWFDDGEELSELWFSSESNFNEDASIVGGIEAADRETCFLWGDNEYLASDIEIVDFGGVGWLSERINSVALCQSPSSAVEDALLHEVGHGMALEHDNSILTVMNERGLLTPRRCDVAANWAPKPWPDESQGIMSMYGRSDWADFVDVSGSHVWGTQSNPTITSTLDRACRSQGIVSENAGGMFGFSHGNHFGNAGGTRHRYEIVPLSYGGTNPNGNSVASSNWYNAIPSGATQPGASFYLTNQAVTFDASGVPFRNVSTSLRQG